MCPTSEYSAVWSAHSPGGRKVEGSNPSTQTNSRTLIGAMWNKLWNLLFGDNSLLRQAYVQFFLALIGGIVTANLPQRIQITIITIISWWAISITAQGFISAASSNKKLTALLEHIEDLVERVAKVEKNVRDVKAETVESDEIHADKISADEIEEK